MKKQIARLLLLCMLLSALSVLSVLPTVADEPRLTTDKTTYTTGEPIMVTATGTGADWVGLYLADELYDSDNGGMVSIHWYYVARDGNTSGAAKDITKADYNNFSVRPAFASGLPAGEYKIVLMENDGYNELARVNITVVAKDTPATPDEPAGDWAPTEQQPVVTNKTHYDSGEDILVKALGSGKDWVGIYAEGERVGDVSSIYWFYVEEGEYTAGDVRVLQEETLNDNRLDGGVLADGSYVLYLLANDGYDILGSVSISVGEPPVEAPVAPKSASYKSAEAGVGRADGTLTVTRGEKAPESFVIRWGDGNGPLEGYTEVAVIPCTGDTTTYTLTPNTLVPLGADRLLVYAKNGDVLSDRATTAKLPAGAGDYELGKNLGELQVMSDIHINPSDSHIHNKHFAAALADIKALSPNSMGIFVNGDIADHGQRAEYEAFNRLIKAAGEGVPSVFCAIGNHDLGGGQSAEAQIAQFLTGTNNDSDTVYFEREIGGYRFIFLGGETVSTSANLSRAQLDWLEETLDKGENDGKPVFLLLHQGVKDMVAGTFAYQGWHGVDQGERLKTILKDHPEVVMFAGHSHWTLESFQSIKPADEQFPTVLNTSSCAYLWDDEANKTNKGIEGSQGYYITLYETGIAFRGRDFANGLWTSSAQFFIPWALGSGDETTETTPDTTEPDTTEPETTDPVIDTTADTIDADTTADGSVPDPVEGTAAGTGDETTSTDRQGCASSVGAAALVTVLSLGVLLGRRKDESPNSRSTDVF